jgi:hypothetical protein
MPWQLIYDHIGDRLAMAVTSEVAGFEARNLEDGSRRTFWTATGTGEQTFTYDAGVGQTIDVGGVTLGRADLLAVIGAHVAVQWSNDAATGWTNIGTPREPLQKAHLLQPGFQDYDEEFSGLAKRGWRLRLYGTMSAAPSFAGLTLGTRKTVRAPAWGGQLGVERPDRGADLEFAFPLAGPEARDDSLAYVRAVSLGFPAEAPYETASGVVRGGLSHFLRDDTGEALGAPGAPALRQVILMNPGDLTPVLEHRRLWRFPAFRWRTVV